jgi:NitT/TauT family transport system ATP-binding protein
MLITHSVEEAIYLAHRVVVLSNRPTRVHEVVEVDVPLPRTPESRTTPAFIELRQHLEQVMRSLSHRPASSSDPSSPTTTKETP